MGILLLFLLKCDGDLLLEIPFLNYVKEVAIYFISSFY